MLHVTAELLRVVGICCQPFVPRAAAKLLDLLAVPAEERILAHATADHAIAEGIALPAPEGIFPALCRAEGGGRAGLMLIDSHCHLDFPDLAADLDGVLSRARAAGVDRMITISTHVGRVATYRALAEAHEALFFTVGTHPHYADQELDVTAEQLARLSEHPKCVGIGEAGLDFHYDKAPREAQAQGLRTHIAAARMTQLPLVIHARAADEMMGDILEEESGKGAFPAVLHCFSSARS